MFQYKAELIRVIDGDTIEVRIDVGFNIFAKHIIRLAGVNCSELRSNVVEIKLLALRAKERVQNLLENPNITITTFKPYPNDKYGRWVAQVTNSNGENISSILLSENLASHYV
jgi:micrococcal nuclease